MELLNLVFHAVQHTACTIFSTNSNTPSLAMSGSPSEFKADLHPARRLIQNSGLTTEPLAAGDVCLRVQPALLLNFLQFRAKSPSIGVGVALQPQDREPRNRDFGYSAPPPFCHFDRLTLSGSGIAAAGWIAVRAGQDASRAEVRPRSPVAANVSRPRQETGCCRMLEFHGPASAHRR